jgi:hypothetical protein
MTLATIQSGGFPGERSCPLNKADDAAASTTANVGRKNMPAIDAPIHHFDQTCSPIVGMGRASVRRQRSGHAMPPAGEARNAQ